MAILEVSQLSKKYKANDFYSLKDVSFTLNEGEIVGLIGRNGAGKSTLLKMLAKSLRPTEGSIYYNGQDLLAESNQLEDFSLLIDTTFYPQFSVEENLEFYLRIHDKQQYRPNIEKILRLLDLWERRKDKPTRFSFGMKQRTALAIALVAEPKILLLDEPFVGLDPVGTQKIIDVLKQWASDSKVMMLISSHQLGQLDRLCDRFMYIANGELSSQIDKSEASEVIEVQVPIKPETLEILPPETFTLAADQRHLTLQKSAISNEIYNQLLQQLITDNQIVDINHVDSDLKQYFD